MAHGLGGSGPRPGASLAQTGCGSRKEAVATLMGLDRRARHRDTFLSALKTSPQLMGILNVTPDSFSDGGRHSDLAAAVARARAMVADGAAIVDVGGESTRPEHVPVPEDEELRRALALVHELPGGEREGRRRRGDRQCRRRGLENA